MACVGVLLCVVAITIVNVDLVVACDAGHYGINCESSCSDRHCRGSNTTCDHVTGHCSDGCQDWFLGDACIAYINMPKFNHTINIKGMAISSTLVKVIWRPDDGVIANQTRYYGYQVEYKVNDESEFLLGPKIFPIPNETEHSTIISNLVYNTWYILRVNMFRQHGVLFELSKWPSHEVMVKTLCNGGGCSNTGIITGAVIGGVVLMTASIVIVVFICRRREANKNIGEELSRLPYSSRSSYRSRTPTKTTVPMSLACLKVHSAEMSKELATVISTKDGKRDITNGFEKEFDDLPGMHAKPCTVGLSEVNVVKNRFKNIQPFDETRVKLNKSTKAMMNSDYINASYIMGYPRKRRHYIATQGPLEDTVVAFWLMIWQQFANRIVMLSKLIEGGKRKCKQYWPDDEELKNRMRSGPFTIQLMLSEMHVDYVYRKLRLSYKAEAREIHQFHFQSWEDKQCPEDHFPLLAFRDRISLLSCDATGPLIVHCSSGVGRTGTYIALDYLLNQARCEGEVDVFACAHHLGIQRMNLVQTEEQYRFLYEAVLEGFETLAEETGIRRALEQYQFRFELAKCQPSGLP